MPPLVHRNRPDRVSPYPALTDRNVVGLNVDCPGDVETVQRGAIHGDCDAAARGQRGSARHTRVGLVRVAARERPAAHDV